MIIGSGLLASVFDPEVISAAGAIVFASGVSNSRENRPEAFMREQALLDHAMALHAGTLVYFSTCSISDPHRIDTPYVQHKLNMEALVARRPKHLILRLPQVVGRTSNPHTLTNFLASRIREQQSFEIWRDAVRCLVDADAVAALTTYLLLEGPHPGTPIDIAPGESITMGKLVEMMETVLGKKAVYSVVEQGGGASPDPSFAVGIASRIGLNLGAGHTLRTLRKYYGDPHAH